MGQPEAATDQPEATVGQSQPQPQPAHSRAKDAYMLFAVGGHNNITSAWAVDQEFVNLDVVPFASCGCLWLPFGSTLGSLCLL